MEQVKILCDFLKVNDGCKIDGTPFTCPYYNNITCTEFKTIDKAIKEIQETKISLEEILKKLFYIKALESNLI